MQIFDLKWFLGFNSVKTAFGNHPSLYTRICKQVHLGTGIIRG